MHELFAALLAQPTARTYKQLRSQLLADRSLGHFSLRLADLERRLSECDSSQASELIAGMLPTGLLSLRLHRLAGQAALDAASHQRAQLHRFTYDALTTAILATGDGTRRRPLLITYGSDAAELLAARGLNVQSQSLVEVKGRRYDVLLCSNEREFWFDVTDLLPETAVAARRKQRPKRGAAARPARKRVVSR